jgi:hypothetical protein
MSVINDVKNKIKDKLDTLVGTSLGTVLISDIKKDPLDMEVFTYPAAFIMPPALGSSARLTNKELIRELTFSIMVVLKMDDVINTQQVEDLMQAMVDVLDNSITLDNVAIAGVTPTTSFPEPFIHNGNSLIVFDILCKARVVQLLTFS